MSNQSNCRSCGAQIVWFKTAQGKNIPVNAETVEPGDEQLELPRHISHFATCPHAKTWRQPR